MAANFHLAPPPTPVDGLTAVPIDIESILDGAPFATAQLAHHLMGAEPYPKGQAPRVVYP